MCGNGWNRLAFRKAPWTGDVQAFVTFLYLIPYLTFFLNGTTDQRAGPICTHDSSNDAFWSKEAPFEGRVTTKFPKEVRKPQKPSILHPYANFPAK